MDFLHNIFNLILPEIALVGFIFVQLIFSIKLDMKFYKISKWITLLALIMAAGLCLKVQVEPLAYGFSNALVSDYFTLFFKGLILFSASLVVFLTKRDITSRRDNAFRYNALILSATLGALSMVSSNDFLTLFVSMETLGFSLFFLTAFEKGFSSKAAAFKYIVISTVASLVYLFGVSYMYGITSSLNFTVIYEYFLEKDPTLLYPLASIFIVSGLLLKLGAVPFANWIVDVYAGASTAVVTFISIVPKLAAFGVLARLLVFPLSYSFELKIILVVISVITALWANLLAIRQKNIKKILACSSSANAAYMLFALALVNVFNLSSVLFYLIAYLFMNIGAFSAVVILENSEFSNRLFEFKNFAYTNPIFTLCFCICILGLAGFPITSGFISKIYIFSAIARSGIFFLPFLVIMMATIVVSVFYYLTIVKHMFERSETVASEVIPHKTSSAIVILYVCAAVTIVIGIIPSQIIELCQIIAYNI